MYSRTAADAYRMLNGVICIHKRPGKRMGDLISAMKQGILGDLNNTDRFQQRPMMNRVAYHEENWGTEKPLATLVPDLSDHPKVVGPRYHNNSVQLSVCEDTADFMSGLCVLGINECPELFEFQEARHMCVYHAKGMFGKATMDFTMDGKTQERSTYRHVKRHNIERLLIAIQAGHQKYMHHISGVDLQSEKAYELASKGLLRARVGAQSAQLIYAIKCIDLKLPHFTLEIHCVNESVESIGRLMHKIGLELRTNACMTQCRRIRWGNFTLDHAIVKPNICQLKTFMVNLDMCRSLLTKDRLVSSDNIVEMQPPLISSGTFSDMSGQLRPSGQESRGDNTVDFKHANNKAGHVNTTAKQVVLDSYGVEVQMPRHINEREMPRHINEQEMPRHINEREMPRHINEREMPRHINEREMPRHINEREMPRHINEREMPRHMNLKEMPWIVDGEIVKYNDDIEEMVKHAQSNESPSDSD